MRRLLALPLLVLAGCALRKAPEVAPRTVVYRCADDTDLRVVLAERWSATVDGKVLPYVPTFFTTRYSDGTTTLWLSRDGEKATFGSRTCRRIPDPA